MHRRGLLPSLIGQAKSADCLMHFASCESHREVLLYALLDHDVIEMRSLLNNNALLFTDSSTGFHSRWMSYCDQQKHCLS